MQDEVERHKSLARLKGACAFAHGFPITAEHGYAGDNAIAWRQGYEYCRDFVGKEDTALDALRKDGWMVAVHNDYWHNGLRFTFWLLTKGTRFIKGEGRTDEEALKIAAASRGE